MRAQDQGWAEVWGNVTHFEKSIESALDSGYSNLIIDLESMPVIDSCGIGFIVNALLKAKKQGGDAKLVNPSQFAMKTMKLCGIYGLFSVYSSNPTRWRPAPKNDPSITNFIK